MLTYFMTPGISHDATDHKIRKRYLKPIKRHPPTREPEFSQKIIEVHKALKDQRSQLKSNILGIESEPNWHVALNKLLPNQSREHINPNLTAFIEASGVIDD